MAAGVTPGAGGVTGGGGSGWAAAVAADPASRATEARDTSIARPGRRHHRRIIALPFTPCAPHLTPAPAPWGPPQKEAGRRGGVPRGPAMTRVGAQDPGRSEPVATSRVA